MKRSKPSKPARARRIVPLEELRRENRKLRAELRSASKKAPPAVQEGDDDLRAVSDMRDREQIYRQMFTNLSAVRLLIEPATGAIVDANPAACMFYGYEKATLLSMKIGDINTLPKEQITAQMRMGFRGKAFFRFKHRLASGAVRDVDVYTSPITIRGRSFLNSIIHDVTDTVRAQEALESLNAELERRVNERTEQLSRSEETFEKAFRATPNAVCLVNMATRAILDANDEFLQITRYSKEEVVGRTFLELHLWPDESDRLRLLACMISSGSVREFDTKFRMKDGTIKDVVINGETVTIGGQACYLFAGRDVTELKIMEEYALKDEQRLKKLVDLLQVQTDSIQHFLDLALEQAIHLTGSAIGYIYHYSEDTREFVLNSWSVEAMKKCRVQEPQTIYKLEHTGLWGEAVRQRRPIIVNDFQADNPLKKGTPEGHVPLKRFLTTPHFVGNRIVAVVGVANKSTDYEHFDVMQLQLLMGSIWGKVESIRAAHALKMQAEALAKREEQYRLLFENMTTGFALHEMIYDDHGDPRDYRYLEVNPAFEELSGTPASQIVGRTIRELYPDAPSDWVDKFGDVARTGKPIRYQSYAEPIGRYFDTLAYSPRANQFALIISDVTDEQKSREMRERLWSELELKNTELERSNKDLDDFAYIASHDLQEPLRMVSSYTQLLAKRYGPQLDGDARDFIQFAVDGAGRMQELIKSLLSYSRIGREATAPGSVDCNEVIADVMQNLKIALDESGAVITSDHLPTLRAHRVQLLQLFQNLIGNAVKFRGKEPPQIHIGLEREGDLWHFRVEDNGIGIDPEYFDRIFMVFQRLHHREQYEGTGIGLAICRKIVERQGGRIWVTSHTGLGSTFHFTLREGDGAQ